jgi:hypothetical protein
MASPAAPIASSLREIRVFISSTFCYMQEEHQELAKQIFPQAALLVGEPRRPWGEVNLRWAWLTKPRPN